MAHVCGSIEQATDPQWGAGALTIMGYRPPQVQQVASQDGVIWRQRHTHISRLDVTDTAPLLMHPHHRLQPSQPASHHTAWSLSDVE